MTDAVRVVSPSQLDTWTACPRRYRWRYLADPPAPRRGAFAHTTLGSAVHAALRGWWYLAPERRTPDVVAATVAEHWSDAGFADATMSRRWLRRVSHSHSVR